MEQNTTNAFFRFLRLSDKDQSNAWKIIIILTLGLVCKFSLSEVKNSYERELQGKDKIIESQKIEISNYKKENKSLLEENRSLWSNKIQKIDSVNIRINKLIDKIEKK